MKRLLSFVFLLTSCLSVTASVLAKEVRVAIIQTASLPIVANSTAAFKNELVKIMPNANIIFDIYDAQGSQAQAAQMVEQISRKETLPDLIVSVATLATRALYSAEMASDIPKLFMTVADPIKEGIVEEFNTVSRTNITGESHVLDVNIKLDILDGLLTPSTQARPFTIALLHTDYPSSASSVASLLKLDENYDSINFVPVATKYVEGEAGAVAMTEGILQAFKQTDTQFDGYWLSSGPLQESPILIDSVRQNMNLMPLFAENLASVKKGALLGVLTDESSIGKSAATRAREILMGRAANTIPVSRTDQYTVAVNVSTAIKINVPIPSSYLKLAKNNVYH